MTEQQLFALQELVQRPLSQEEAAEIDPLLPNRNDVQIADVLSRDRVRTQERHIGVGTVLDALGPVEGAQVLDALEGLKGTNSAVKWAFVLLERGELNVGAASVRGQIDALTPAVFSEAQADILKGLAEVADPINYNTVSDALNIAEGRVTL